MAELPPEVRAAHEAKIQAHSRRVAAELRRLEGWRRAGKGRPWTEADIARLRALRDQRPALGVFDFALSARRPLGRTVHAIVQALYRYGIE